MDASAWVGAAGLVTAVLGGIAGILAALSRRRETTDAAAAAAAARVTADRDALTADYRNLLDEMRRHLAEQERRMVEDESRVRARLDELTDDLEEARLSHEACEASLATERVERASMEARLRAAELRIAHLGGGSPT